MVNVITKLCKAYINSWRGLKSAYQSQWSLRFVSIIVVIAIPLAFYISQHNFERMLLISSILLLPMIELMNTAVETTINRISLEQHELSGQAKDIASAAMLVAIINAMIIWSIALYSGIFNHS